MANNQTISQIVRNFTLFVDGNLFSGDVETVKLPDLKKKMEEYRGGGMDIPVEIQLGMEKITFEFDVTCHSDILYETFAGAQGNHKLFKFYGSLMDVKGTETGVTIEVQGPVISLDAGDAKPGAKTTAKLVVNAYYLKHVINGVVVIEIDALNLVFVSNGVDSLSTTRQLLGL